MALSSERKKNQVDPARGIYVEMEGVMEVRWSSEDIDNQPEAEDFWTFQDRVRDIPEDYCHKDKCTTLQAFFFCIVCDCELKSIKSLKDHCLGQKHIRKAMEKKRIIFDLPAQPKNAPREKKIKRPQPRIDLNKSLKERLEDSAQPAVGLQFIEEYRNPKEKSAHRMYTCTLTGCKSAWGNSDDMYNHVIKYKHSKNFFKVMHPDDTRIAGLSNADVLTKAAELADEEEERDYNVIVIVNDLARYVDLRDRPDEWSEKKARLGLVGKSANSNHEPLGNRKGKGGGFGKKGGGGLGASGSGLNGASGSGMTREEDRKHKKRVNDESPFDEEAWKDWKPIDPITRYENWFKSIRKVARNVLETAKEFEGTSRESSEYKETMAIIKNKLILIDLDKESGLPPEQIEFNYWLWVDEMKAKFAKAEELLNEKTDGQEQEMKHIAKLLDEFEEEIKRYHADRDSKKYKNIQMRMTEITKELSSMNCNTPFRESRMADFNKRLGSLWQNFEENSNDREPALSSMLESQMKRNHGKTSREERLLRKENAVANFKRDLMIFIRDCLDRYQYNPHLKIEDKREFEALVDYFMGKIVVAEVNSWGNTGNRWEDFGLRNNTKDSTRDYINKKMSTHVPGSRR